MSYSLKPRIRRDQLAPGDSLCDHCTARCCGYFALPIDTPATFQDFEFMRWYLLHKDVTIFTEDDQWYLLVHNSCTKLQSDNRCGIYEHRPQICREYSTANCEYEDGWVYQRYFETGEQLWEYVEAVLGPRHDGIRSAKPSLLPIL